MGHTVGNAARKRAKWGRHWRRFTCIVGLLLVVIVAVAISIPRLAAHALSGDWPSYMDDNGHTGYNSAETVINSTTAPHLKLHWKHLAGGKVTTQPIEANGLVYWGSWDGLEHATNPSTGLDTWTANLGQTTMTCSGVKHGVLSSAAVASVSIGGVTTPVVFVGGGDVQIYALNANTGAVIWKTPLGTQPDYFLYGSPLVYQSSVYIGVSSHGDCPLIQGQLVQLDVSTGTIQHTFNVVPNGCLGGSVWTAPTVDSTTGIIYFSTGNTGTCSSTETMAQALIAVHSSDLSLVGSWQVPASQVINDGDFGSTPTLFNATMNGTPYQMVGLLNKNGIYYAFNRSNISTGPLWQVRLGQPPGSGKGDNIASSAWDGTTLYTAAASTTSNGKSCAGSLRALNPANGAFIWQDCLSSDIYGPVTMVPGLAVVSGGTSFMIVNASTGKQLFSFQDKSSKSNFLGPSSISNGVLYQGNNDGYLYAFGT